MQHSVLLPLRNTEVCILNLAQDKCLLQNHCTVCILLELRTKRDVSSQDCILDELRFGVKHSKHLVTFYLLWLVLSAFPDISTKILLVKKRKNYLSLAHSTEQ